MSQYRVDYYAESKKRIKLFEETLERFSQTLEKHDLAKKIDIAIKKPSEYNLKDVINIADKVYERHKTAPDVKSCTGAIRKCFRFAGRNASPLQCLLNFVPSDSYGSVISGGFTVILAVSLVRLLPIHGVWIGLTNSLGCRTSRVPPRKHLCCPRGDP